MKTQFERINVNDAYRLARELGTHCATLYVERLVTEHVRRVKGTNEWYFIYNPAGNYFDDMILYEKGIKESFIPVK